MLVNSLHTTVYRIYTLNNTSLKLFAYNPFHVSTFVKIYVGKAQILKTSINRIVGTKVGLLGIQKLGNEKHCDRRIHLPTDE